MGKHPATAAVPAATDDGAVAITANITSKLVQN